jgi:hypothetical protein
MRSKLIAIAAVVLVLGGCDRRDPDHATSDATTSTGAVTSFITPPAEPERGPIPPDANAAAPGTNASLAFAENSGEKPLKLPSSEGGTPQDLHVALAAQQAAAKAPDTAAADAAKRRVYEEYAEGGTAGGETVASASLGPPATRPESREMPMAGQANDHSSTALDKPST